VEELAGAGEALEPAGVDKVMRVRATDETFDVPALWKDVESLVHAAALGRSDAVLEWLRRIVPSFNGRAQAASVGSPPPARAEAARGASPATGRPAQAAPSLS